MKSINLASQHADILEIVQAAEEEPVVLYAPNGHEFLISSVDDFDEEIESLRNNPQFQELLDDRLQQRETIPIETLLKETEEEIAQGHR